MAWLGIVAIRVYNAQPVASITAQLASHTRTVLGAVSAKDAHSIA